MDIKKLKLNSPVLKRRLKGVDPPLKSLYFAGATPEELLSQPVLTVVGSRRMSVYGQKATYDLVQPLARQGVVIASGLALGIDAAAHRATLDAKGRAIAILPTPLDNIAPVSNRRLARQIVEGGGTLVSEYTPGEPVYKINFIARNRIMAGLGDALLVTEAALKSGTLHTARFALEQGKTVMAVPGDIYRPGSAGTNNLITSGAIPVTSAGDILAAMNLKHEVAVKQVHSDDPHEEVILKLLGKGIDEGNRLLELSGLDVVRFNQALTMLEINGRIRPLGAGHWAIC
jgi:DNA processing protein